MRLRRRGTAGRAGTPAACRGDRRVRRARARRVRRLTVRGALTTLRRAQATDVDRLCGWHADPEVSRYWDDETFTRAELEASLAEPDFEPWIIEAHGEPVGYLQAWWHPGQPRRGGLDGFIAPAARGRGLFPDAARSLARFLLAAGWSEITVDPYTWNERAVRGWRKAGFEPVEERPPDADHPEAWLLMRFAG